MLGPKDAVCATTKHVLREESRLAPKANKKQKNVNNLDPILSNGQIRVKERKMKGIKGDRTDKICRTDVRWVFFK